jgi:hypothetical protein
MELLERFCHDYGRVPRYHEKYEKYENRNLGNWLHITQKSKINTVQDEAYLIMAKIPMVKNDLDRHIAQKHAGPGTQPSHLTQ